MEHLLIKRATRFDTSVKQNTDGWLYRKDIGAWVDANMPEVLLVNYNPFNVLSDQGPNKPKPEPMSKKCDIETGEDMKGE